MSKSKSDFLIIAAVERGYTADAAGNIYTPTGNKLQLSKNNNGYLSFMPNIGKREDRRTVLAHRFIIYFFYKEALFEWPLVRHINDIKSDNRLDNLAVGTKKDNRRDIGFERLSQIAKSHSHILVAFSRKLTDEQILEMRRVRERTKLSYAKLAQRYNVSAMTVYRAIKKQSWSNV